jgi:hypothetical protein
MKQCGTKVSCSNDFLGSGHTREVATTSAAMEIVQVSIIFIDGEALTKNGVDPMSV